MRSEGQASIPAQAIADAHADRILRHVRDLGAEHQPASGRRDAIRDSQATVRAHALHAQLRTTVHALRHDARRPQERRHRAQHHHARELVQRVEPEVFHREVEQRTTFRGHDRAHQRPGDQPVSRARLHPRAVGHFRSFQLLHHGSVQRHRLRRRLHRLRRRRTRSRRKSDPHRKERDDGRPRQPRRAEADHGLSSGRLGSCRWASSPPTSDPYNRWPDTAPDSPSLAPAG